MKILWQVSFRPLNKSKFNDKVQSRFLDNVKRFNGDWSFAIYDIKKGKLFCSRDRFGVKPFNYAIINNYFIFSSEIKSIIKYYPELKNPIYNVIGNFCHNSLGAQIEDTWFCDIIYN